MKVFVSFVWNPNDDISRNSFFAAKFPTTYILLLSIYFVISTFWKVCFIQFVSSIAYRILSLITTMSGINELNNTVELLSSSTSETHHTCLCW